jgi:hypothetical protein
MGKVIQQRHTAAMVLGGSSFTGRLFFIITTKMDREDERWEGKKGKERRGYARDKPWLPRSSRVYQREMSRRQPAGFFISFVVSS